MNDVLDRYCMQQLSPYRSLGPLINQNRAFMHVDIMINLMPEVIPACLTTKFQKNALSVSILMFSSVSSKKDYNISVAVKFTFCNGSYIQICAACSDSTYRSKGFQ